MSAASLWCCSGSAGVGQGEVVGDGFRQVGAQGLREAVLRVGAFGGDERVGRQVGQVVEGDGRAALPPGGDL